MMIDRACRPQLKVFTGDRRPKNIRGDHGDFSAFGERDRAERFFASTDDVFNRVSRQ
jgi:hypothetical protein